MTNEQVEEQQPIKITPSHISRFFALNECQKYLRLCTAPKKKKTNANGKDQKNLDSSKNLQGQASSSSSKEQREEEHQQQDQQLEQEEIDLVSQQNIERGMKWEEDCLRILERSSGTTSLFVAAPSSSARRTFPFEAFRDNLEKIISIFSSSPSRSIDTCFLYQQELEFEGSICIPDFLKFTKSPSPSLPNTQSSSSSPPPLLLTVIDAKASAKVKPEHLIQISLYCEILARIRDRDQNSYSSRYYSIDRLGGIWLSGNDDPQYQDLDLWRQAARRLVFDPTSQVQRARRDDSCESLFHFAESCSTCPYRSQCERLLRDNPGHISHLPYLSNREFDALKSIVIQQQHPSAPDHNHIRSILEAMDSASNADIEDLLGKKKIFAAGNIRQKATAILEKSVQPFGSKALSIPEKREGLSIAVTVDIEPNSEGDSSVRAFGLLLVANGVSQDPQPYIYSTSRPDSADLLVRKLHSHLSDAFQSEKSVLLYIYSQAEANAFSDYLKDLLIERSAANGDPDTVQKIEQIYHSFFVDPAYLSLLMLRGNGELRVPRYDSCIPKLVVLENEIKRTVALPRSSFYTFDDCLEIIAVAGNRADDSPTPVIRRTHDFFRIILGYRELLKKEKLFAVKSLEPFVFPIFEKFQSGIVSSLAFLNESEKFFDCFESRTKRLAGEQANVESGSALLLEKTGGSDSTFRLLNEPQDRKMLEEEMPVWLATSEDFDDAKYAKDAFIRSRKYFAVGIKSFDAAENTLATSASFSLGPGQKLVLYHRYFGPNTDKIRENLKRDDIGAFVELIQDPARWNAKPISGREHLRMQVDRIIREKAEQMTESQKAALFSICDLKLNLIWGPPGVGKVCLSSSLSLSPPLLFSSHFVN